jgi:glutathione S-transferase
MGNGLDGRRILWGVGSPRTMRAHWALHELSLPYECEAVSARGERTRTESFAALNPRQKIPVLQDGDFTIAESAAIIAYLAEAYGEEQRLVPAGGRARAQWLEWSAFICMELDATALYVIRRHVGLPQIYGEAPAAVEAARSYFVKQLGCVDQALRDERRYLMGDDFTTADILLGTCLAWAVKLEVPVCESGQAYLGRVTARAAYPKALAANAVRPEQTPAPK